MSNNDKVPELTNGEFEEFIQSGYVLIDFYGDWCMPCIMMAPVVEDVSDKFKGKIKFGKVNIADNVEIASKFGVNSVPTFILFKNGERKKEFVGSMSAEDFEEKLNKFV